MPLTCSKSCKSTNLLIKNAVTDCHRVTWMAASVWQISLHISCFTLKWGWKYLFWLITLLVLCSWLWNFDLRFCYCKGNKKFWYICIFHLTKYHILQVIRHTGPYYAPRSQKVNVGKKYFIGPLISSWQTCAEWNGSLCDEASKVVGNYLSCPFDRVRNASSS